MYILRGVINTKVTMKRSDIEGLMELRGIFKVRFGFLSIKGRSIFSGVFIVVVVNTGGKYFGKLFDGSIGYNFLFLIFYG